MGGAQRVASYLVTHWASLGHSVSVIVTFSGSSHCHYALPPEAGIIYLADEAEQGGVFSKSKPGRIAVLRRLFRKLRPHVIVSFITDANLAALLASVGMGIPTIVSERCYPPREHVPAIYRLLRWKIYPWATRVVFPTHAGMNWLQRHIPGSQGAVIPNPVTYPVPHAAPRVEVDSYVPAGVKLVASVGRLELRKGHDELIRAFAMACSRFPEWKLAIVGDGPCLASLQQLGHELGVHERLIFPGSVGNVGDWYERAEIFVLPSHFEGFPNVLVEAMSYGCACISYDCDTGPGEIIVHGDNGLLIPRVGDIKALSGALADVLESSDLRNQLSSNAKRVRETYSMKSVFDQWDALIASSLASSRNQGTHHV